MNTTPNIRITILSSRYCTDTLTFKHHPFVLHSSILHSLLQVVSFGALGLAFISQSGFLFCILWLLPIQCSKWLLWYLFESLGIGFLPIMQTSSYYSCVGEHNPPLVTPIFLCDHINSARGEGQAQWFTCSPLS
jgi:hypothetical protein